MSASSRLLCLLGLAALAGCPFSFTNEEHCAANDGDAFCASADPSRPYCALDGCSLYDEVGNRSGCVAERPADMACYSPCGGKQDANANADCEAGTDAGTVGSTGSSGTTASTTEDTDVPSTTDTGCDCDNPTPICRDDQCVACDSDSDCEAEFAGVRDYCTLEGCVACKPEQAESQWHHVGCSDAALEEPPRPTCEAGECVPWCLFPSDCPTTGCAFEYGLCASPQNVVYVDGVAGTPEGDGSSDDPFSTISAAIGELGSRGQPDYRLGTVLIRVGSADHVYEETISFTGQAVVLRAASDDDPPVLRSSGEQPLFTVQEGAEGATEGELHVVNLRFEGSPGPLVRLEPQTRFFADGAVMLDNAAVLIGEGGRAFLRNSVVAGSTQTPFQFPSSSDLGIVSSTIIENPVPLVFDCTDTQTSLSIRDSIVGRFENGLSFDELRAECSFVRGDPMRSVLGDVSPAASFKENDDYELEAGADSRFQVNNEDITFCEEGQTIDAVGTLLPCPPTEDIDGTPRNPQNWMGFSVP